MITAGTTGVGMLVSAGAGIAGDTIDGEAIGDGTTGVGTTGVIMTRFGIRTTEVSTEAGLTTLGMVAYTDTPIDMADIMVIIMEIDFTTEEVYLTVLPEEVAMRTIIQETTLLADAAR